VRPTPTGANGVALCFSAPSMSTARQSAAVMNISMNTACAEFTFAPGDVLQVWSTSEVERDAHEAHTWTRAGQA
jgi:hypothetical protein